MPLTNPLVNHDSGWRAEFEAEAVALRQVFQDRLVSIHHVGSTCIPGIQAKPEIDILVVLDEVDSISQYSNAMVEHGYAVRGEEDDPGHFYYSKDSDGTRSHKVHACLVGHRVIWEMLLFKAYLLANQSRAQRYESLKTTLHQGNPEGMREYLEGKEPFIRETLSLALADGYEKPRS